MHKIKTHLALLATVLGLLYAGISLSPLKDAIGRRNPEIASLFAPPRFNFSNVYDHGSVLQFEVGMPKAAVFAKLSGLYADRADLTVRCTVTTANSVVPITKGLDIADVYGGGPSLCVRLDARRLAVDFQFQNDVVSSIAVIFIRTESF